MGLRIVSVVLAVVIWFILSISLFPTIHTTVYEVPVKIDITGTFAAENGLSVVNFDKSATVDVSLSGMRYEVGNYSADDLVATVEVRDVYKDGTYNLGISVKSAHGDDLNIQKITPSTLKVRFDYIKTMEFPMEVEYTGVSAAQGYTLGTPIVEPQNITVKGPESEISRISRAVVKVDENRLDLTEPFSTDNTEIVFYTKNGKAIDSKNLEYTQDVYNVTFPVYMSKTVPFTLDVRNTPENFDGDSLDITFEPETITIHSNKDISALESINVGALNLNEIELDKEYEVEISLEKDMINASGTETVTVKFDGENYSSRTFTLLSDNIRILNKPTDKNVEVRTNMIPGVVITGPKDIVTTIRTADLIAEYDMQSASVENGNIEVSVKIYSEKNNTVWYSGEPKSVVLAVSDNKPTVDTDSQL